MLAVFSGMLISMVRGYIVKLATKEFAHWALFEIAEAIVQSTETKEDDKWLEQIRKTVEEK